MARIKISDVTKRYDNGFVAVKNVSFEIHDGEFVVLVGPSGCGKSTTLRMIAGLEKINEGDLFIGERRVNDLEPGDRDIAMVFQNYALYPHMSVRQNMSFGLKMRRESKTVIEQRVEEAARILSIESLLDKRPAELSGGQRQRVAVGRAIVRKPAAFLFDEPLSNLDAKLRVQMRIELSRLHQQLKTTTVYVTHDQVEAMTLGDRIVVMKDGLIQQVDTPLNLYNSPTNRFVASFIGSPSMNFINGSIENGCFKSNAIEFALPGNLASADSVVFGFRPEDLTFDEGFPKLVDATVDVAERLGHETFVYFDCEGEKMAARIQGDFAVQPGESLQLRLPGEKAHLFDSNGERLSALV